MAKAPAPRYFVYELIDPRNDKPFYVGKGMGNRPNQHLKDAAAGVNSHKCNKIRSIQGAGHEVGINIVKHFRSEDAAYAFEARHIARIGLGNLTNICPGGRGNVTSDPDRQLISAIATLAKKTGGLAKKSYKWTFCGHELELPEVFISNVRTWIRRIIDTRGHDWAAEEFSRHGVQLYGWAS